MPSSLVRTLVPVSIVFATSLSSPSGRSVGAAGRPEPIAVITGRVVDSASSQPLGGVVVSVRETTLNVQTDPQGNYRLNVPVDSATGRDLVMVVRRIGYQPATRALHVTAGTRTEHFALSASQVMLEQVVVTGTSNGARMSKKAIGANVMRRAGSAAGSRRSEETAEVRDKDRGNTEGYDVIAENPFLTTASAPRSTFSIDVDHASYSNVRRFLRQGERPPRDAVRLEELINYFPYDLPAPRGEDPVTITTEVSTAPWNPAHRLVRIGLKGRPIDVDSLPPNNLVFLIDVSGSMED